ASLGRGRVTASGFAEPLGPGARPFWLRANLESPEFSVPQTLDARLGGSVTWAGTDAASRLSGEVTVERLTVTQQVGLGDIMGGGPVRSVRPRADDKRARVALDVDVAVKDRIGVRSNLADLDLAGALHLGGTLLAPQLSGGMYAEDGTFRYLDNEFVIENLNVSFTDPRRQDPYVDLLGTASVVSRSREEYDVTLRVTGFAFDALPELSSAPPLSEPDVLALLTFGDTVGELAAGGGAAVGSSGERLGALTRKAFLGSLFGVAESTMERLLDLDTVELDREAAEAGDLAGAELTLGKRFGDRLRVDYRTALGKLDQREVDISLKLTRTLSLETRADPEGNHAVGLRASLLFE
ncbi:MAG: translocation/assembly module TamB domain-containing protein, partial [Candidatus Eisenbacteria bacterium]|nr:translocation/assembly module TamB domain-containing protein [Candidatus Eisenbacteria bacterium]